MKLKRLFILIVALALLAITCVATFAACDNKKGNNNNSGDSIFTEDATIDDVRAAIKQASSIVYGERATVSNDISSSTYNMTFSYTKEMQMYTVSSHYKSEENGNFYTETSTTMFFNLNGIEYIVEEGEEYDVNGNKKYLYTEKNLLENSEFMSSMANISTLTEEIFMKIENILNEGGVLEMNGDEMLCKYPAVEDENTHLREFYIKGVNSTVIDIPQYIMTAIQSPDCKWAEQVNHNGVHYIKRTDADGNEYYAYDIFDEDNAVLSETINGLPVVESNYYPYTI